MKLIPGISLGAGVLNAIIAGSIVAAIGEGAIYAYEQVYLGEKSDADIDWVKKVMESKLSSQFIDSVKSVAEKITQNAQGKTIANIITETFKSLFSTANGKEV